MTLNNTLLNIGATAMQAAATHATINDTYPDASGATADTARAAITWDTAANGDMVLTVDEAFTGGTPSGAAVGVGLWNSDGSVYYGDLQITSGDVTFNAAGEYTLQSITVTGTAS